MACAPLSYNKQTTTSPCQAYGAIYVIINVVVALLEEVGTVM